MSKAQYAARKSNFETMQFKMAQLDAVIRSTRTDVRQPWSHEYLGIMAHAKTVALRRRAERETLKLSIEQQQRGGLVAISALMTEGQSEQTIENWVNGNMARRRTEDGPVNKVAVNALDNLVRDYQVECALDNVNHLGKKFIDNALAGPNQDYTDCELPGSY